MKNLKLLVVLPAIFTLQSVFAQTAAHLLISDQYPAAGEKISITYDPTGTVVSGKTDIAASVYFLDNKKFPVADVDLKANGKLLNGNFVVPPDTKAFFVRINSGADVDNNNDKGYVYLIYKDKRPVEGAYAMEASVFFSGTPENYYTKVKNDNIEGVRLYKQEFATYPNGDKSYLERYYQVAARLPDYKDAATAKSVELEKSSDEKDLTMAAVILHSLKNNKQADSLDALIKSKFPKGNLVKYELINAFYNEEALAKKDSIYHVYIQKFPDSKTDQSDASDNFRAVLAEGYLHNGDTANFHNYEGQVKNKFSLQGEFNNMAYEWAKKGENLDEAEKLSKESLEIVSNKINDPQPTPFASPKQVKKDYEYTYDMDADTYAFVLAKENKYAEALKYEQAVVDHATSVDPDIYGNYINILAANGMDTKAQAAAEIAVKAGQGTADIKELLKKSYIKSHGNDNGFDQYVAGLEKAAKDKATEEIAKTMINKPAPAFTLTDLDGKTVSLADLKGKVVVVDFWASWCGPCKASFPGMQLAVTKYKDDPNVKFLFLDTWESDSDYLNIVKKFIADNKYSFHVVLDDKMNNGRRGKVVNDYGVDGIPTKFVIDKNGNIRFTKVGFQSTAESLADEVGQMIEMVRNPGDAASVQPAANAKAGSK